MLSFIALQMLMVTAISLDGGTQTKEEPWIYRSVGLLGFESRAKTLKNATWVAIARVTDVRGEPSGLGGDYVAFEIVRTLAGPKSSRAGAGGHGWNSGAKTGDLFLVSLSRGSEFVDKPFPRFWGPTVAKIDAVVNEMIRIDTVEKGVALFKELQSTP